MPERYVGMISGTSVDSIDVAVVEFSDNPDDHRPRLLATLSQPWPDDLRRAIFATRRLADAELGSLAELDRATADAFAEAVLECLDTAAIPVSSVRAIGSHGQTIRHRTGIPQPFSLQIGDAARIAARTGCDVIADFRRADIEAGGEGAPLASSLHQAVFRAGTIDRAIVNIGGIANITLLPAARDVAVTGFDCGPGNNMMDAWCERHTGRTYDEGGAFAASGHSDIGLLARCLLDPYFSLPPPKSTGFELFNLDWFEQHVEDELAPADIQSTLCDLTATAIMRDIHRYAPKTAEIYICGGGAHNSELMRRLQAMSRAPVASTEVLGVHPDWVEAITFAWLARQYVHGRPGNVPSVTGARHACILGARSAA
jgi:anhydro-N-acetylmuramic acid kinase